MENDEKSKKCKKEKKNKYHFIDNKSKTNKSLPSQQRENTKKAVNYYKIFQKIKKGNYANNR